MPTRGRRGRGPAGRRMVVALPRPDVGPAVSIRQLTQERSTALRTQAARLGAQPTMRVMNGVLRALRAALGRCPRTRFELCPPHARLEVVAAGEQAGRARADVRAIEIEPDATPKRQNLRLGQTAVGARLTSEGARGRGLHAPRLGSRLHLLGRPRVTGCLGHPRSARNTGASPETSTQPRGTRPPENGEAEPPKRGNLLRRCDRSPARNSRRPVRAAAPLR